MQFQNKLVLAVAFMAGSSIAAPAVPSRPLNVDPRDVDIFAAQPEAGLEARATLEVRGKTCFVDSQCPKGQRCNGFGLLGKCS